MKYALSLLLIGYLIATSARAQTQANPQVVAATANAVNALHAEVLRLPLGNGVTIGQWLKPKARGDEILVATLQRSEMVGGPRWLDDQTVQVQLQIPARRINDALLQIAAIQPHQGIYTPEYIARQSRAWEDQTFSATGTSAGSGVVERIRPAPANVAWQGVPDEVRKQAIAAARSNADVRILDSLRPIQLSGGKTVGQVLDNPQVKGQMQAFLDSRPIGSVEFMSDRTVTVSIAAPPQEVYGAFRGAAVTAGVMPNDDAAWLGVADLFARSMAQPVGTAVPGSAPPPPRPVAPNNSVVLDRPPEWINRQMDAQGNAVYSGNQLRTARVAEAEAKRNLRAQIEALPLTKDLTLGAAARNDRRVADVIDHAMDRARLYKVDYHEDGTVTAFVSVEAMNIWGELATGR